MQSLLHTHISGKSRLPHPRSRLAQSFRRANVPIPLSTSISLESTKAFSHTSSKVSPLTLLTHPSLSHSLLPLPGAAPEIIGEPSPPGRIFLTRSPWLGSRLRRIASHQLVTPPLSLLPLPGATSGTSVSHHPLAGSSNMTPLFGLTLGADSSQS